MEGKKPKERDRTNGKCAIYVRVSTEEQNPDHQVKALKTYSSNCGYETYKIYKDVISGTKSSRPALNMLMFDMRKRLFNVVIVWKLDRLGRSLQHLLNIVEEFHKRNIDFICVDQNIDTTTASGKFTFHILAAVAEFEREMISERTKLGMRKALKEGRVGRPKGKKDTEPRNKAGYYMRYAKQKMGGTEY